MGLRLDTGRLAPAAVRPPEPEDVFLSWLMQQPPGRDLAAAASAEIHRLRRYQGQHSGPGRLVELFEALHRSLRPSRSGAGRRDARA